MMYLPRLSGSGFRVQARPPRPEIGTGSGGATRLKYIKTRAGFLNLSLYNWALQSQVWARGSRVTTDGNRSQY